MAWGQKITRISFSPLRPPYTFSSPRSSVPGQCELEGFYQLPRFSQGKSNGLLSVVQKRISAKTAC